MTRRQTRVELVVAAAGAYDQLLQADSHLCASLNREDVSGLGREFAALALDAIRRAQPLLRRQADEATAALEATR